ncbi:MAG: hypothetical protein ACJAZO_000654 [Myxococcota bacterium]
MLGQSTPLPDSLSEAGPRRIAIAVDGVPMGPSSLIGGTPAALRAVRADVAVTISGDITPRFITLASGVTVLRASGAIEIGTTPIAPNGALSVGGTTIQPNGAIDVAGDVVVSASGALPMDGQQYALGQPLAGFTGDGSLICRAVATVPSRLIGFFAGDCPSGFEPYEALQGGAVVGLRSRGDAQLGVGQALSNGGRRQITQVPTHAHWVNPPSTNTTGNHMQSILRTRTPAQRRAEITDTLRFPPYTTRTARPVRATRPETTIRRSGPLTGRISAP